MDVAFGVLLSFAAGGAYWPIAIRCPSLGPSPSVGGGAHWPLTARCPSSSSLAYLSLSTSLSFPLVSCANGAPGLSPFHCSCVGPGQQPSPLAGGVQAVIRRRGTPPQRQLLGLGTSTWGGGLFPAGEGGGGAECLLRKRGSRGQWGVWLGVGCPRAILCTMPFAGSRVGRGSRGLKLNYRHRLDYVTTPRSGEKNAPFRRPHPHLFQGICGHTTRRKRGGGVLFDENPHPFRNSVGLFFKKIKKKPIQNIWHSPTSCASSGGRVGRAYDPVPLQK